MTGKIKTNLVINVGMLHPVPNVNSLVFQLKDETSKSDIIFGFVCTQ
jgi:hypothetical protein